MVKTWAGVIALALCTTLLASAKSASLNTAYLVPGGSVKLDRKAIAASKFCALTFDDGPDGVYTPQVAAVLERYGVHATFFVIGQRVSARPDSVLALSRAGHEIANHSWSHPDFTTLSAAERKSQIVRTQTALTKLGLTPRWFRPPYGAFDKSVVKSCQGCGLKPVLWSVDPRDWAEPGVDQITRRVLDESGNGAVILLHSTNAQTVAALPAIIEKLQARGFTFLTMTQWEAAAMGKPVPMQPTAPSGEPPSFREIEALPDAPQLPGAGPGMLASGDGPETQQAAAADWVAAMQPELAEAAASGPAAPAEDPVSGALVELGAPLFIFGNFTHAEDASAILSGKSAAKFKRKP